MTTVAGNASQRGSALRVARHGLRGTAAVLAVFAIASSAGARQAGQPDDSKKTTPPAPGKTPLDRNNTKLPPPPAPRPATASRPDAFPSPAQTPGRTGAASLPLNRSTPRPQISAEGMERQALRILRNRGNPITYVAGDGQEILISPRFGQDGRSVASPDDAKARIIAAAQSGNLPRNNEQLRDTLIGKPVDLETARQQYHEQGYMEGTLNNGDVVFIKSPDWGTFYESMARLNGQISEREVYPDRDGCCCCCSDDPYRHSPTDLIFEPGGSIDTFLAVGMLDRPPFPAAPPPSAAEEARLRMTPVERADLALREGRAEEAVKQYQAYFTGDPESGEDSIAMRSYAIALMSAHRQEEGLKKLLAAYEMDPDLAWRVVDAGSLKDDNAIRELVTAAVATANRSKGAKEWLGVVVLMQAQGRKDLAVKMLDRAKERGLSERIVAEFALSLKERKAALSGPEARAR